MVRQQKKKINKRNHVKHDLKLQNQNQKIRKGHGIKISSHRKKDPNKSKIKNFHFIKIIKNNQKYNQKLHKKKDNNVNLDLIIKNNNKNNNKINRIKNQKRKREM